MIGDTAYDIMGAKQADIAVIAVGYGFGQRENLLLNKPEHFWKQPANCLLFSQLIRNNYLELPH